MISRADYENFLVYVYFGPNTNLLTACINRAYRDFNRTLHGFGGLKNASDIYKLAVNALASSHESLKSIAVGEISADIFDDWHKTTCENLISIFVSNGHHLFVGQAQKWVNMTLKYIFTVGEQRITGFEPVYPYCHVPFDNVLLEQLQKYDFPALNCPWSRLDNYGEYLEKQKWVRQKFSLLPLDVEFLLWLGKEIDPQKIR